jgi:hypothetical protein
MKALSFALAGLSCVTGLYAAWLWWKASNIGPLFMGTEPGTEAGSANWPIGAMMAGGMVGSTEQTCRFLDRDKRRARRYR